VKSGAGLMAFEGRFFAIACVVCNVKARMVTRMALRMTIVAGFVAR
jgi:hypothetical protein